MKPRRDSGPGDHSGSWRAYTHYVRLVEKNHHQSVRRREGNAGAPRAAYSRRVRVRRRSVCSARRRGKGRMRGIEYHQSFT